MRRSTVLTMTIMLVAFGVMFAAAGSALQPLARDADASRSLTRLLEARRDLVPDTRVRVSRLQASDKRLADEGFGLVVRLSPAKAIRNRPGGLRALAIRAAHEALQHYMDGRLRWVEVVFRLGEAEGNEETLRTLLTLTEAEGLGLPEPPLPRRVPARP